MLLARHLARRYKEKVRLFTLGGKQLLRCQFLGLDLSLRGAALLLLAACEGRVQVGEGLLAGDHSFGHKLERGGLEWRTGFPWVAGTRGRALLLGALLVHVGEVLLTGVEDI